MPPNCSCLTPERWRRPRSLLWHAGACHDRLYPVGCRHGGPLMADRTSLTYKIKKAAVSPGRVLPYVRRWARDARLRLASPSHTDFYRAVMADETAKDPDRAIGSDSRDSWMSVGELQHTTCCAMGCARITGFWTS